MMYRAGHPFWKTLSRFGVLLTVRVDVLHDPEANVYVASSDDLRGLVCEAETMAELVDEINYGVEDLLAGLINDGHTRRAVTTVRLRAA
jgi:predicted RNase H-like HicB family nuclease